MNNANLPPTSDIAARVDALVARMTLDEKISQMMNDAPAIERLGVPKYNWWNEALHGVARAGLATVFPQAIALGATWNRDLLHRVATVISDEGRAKYQDAVRRGVRKIYTGLTFWSPNINIFRDPRWGRGQETYGEDPYLTARMGVAFITGLQGDDPTTLKTAACAKHFAVHSGPEAERHGFNAVVDVRDLWETYLPAFQAAVQEAGVESVMTAYNRTNGEACSASPTLIGEILRRRWAFGGHVVSDCGAVDDIYKHHHVAQTAAEAGALAVKAGCDLECGSTYQHLGEAVAQGLIDEATIDQAVKRLFITRFKLGLFDERTPFDDVPYAAVGGDEHGELALQAARESIVLLKNAGGVLPLKNDGSLRKIAVIGPNAADESVLYANYYGTARQLVTPLEGIRAKVAPGTEVAYAPGCAITGGDTSGFAEAVALAKQSDLAVLVLGLSQKWEGEEGEIPGTGDRLNITMPPTQQALLEAVHGTGTPVVLVLINGSALAVEWADRYVPAIVEAWYPGQAGGTAIADVLFGDYNPAGRLPVTFYRSLDQLPSFEDYAMRGENGAKGRTYRYFRETPLYPFGHGLSYTRFSYRDLTVTPSGDGLDVVATVENVGDREGDEVAQVYVSDAQPTPAAPICHLEAFARVPLAPGEAKTVAFHLTREQFAHVNDAGERVFELGAFDIWVGGGQPGTSAPGLSVRVNLM
jgi:beta-glucosidase